MYGMFSIILYRNQPLTKRGNFVGLSMKCYRLGKEKRTYLGERQFKGRIGK